MSRDPTDKVSLTLRMTESLRQKIEDRASKHNRSLNMQVIADLEDAVAQNDVLIARFGSEEIATFMQALASCFVLAQIQTGKAFQEDSKTMERALLSMQALLASFVQREDRSEELDSPETAVHHAMHIAHFAGAKFFARENVPDPDWLVERLNKMRTNKPRT